MGTHVELKHRLAAGEADTYTSVLSAGSTQRSGPRIVARWPSPFLLLCSLRSSLRLRRGSPCSLPPACVAHRDRTAANDCLRRRRCHSRRCRDRSRSRRCRSCRRVGRRSRDQGQSPGSILTRGIRKLSPHKTSPGKQDTSPRRTRGANSESRHSPKKHSPNRRSSMPPDP